jgi:hypothetical protein
MAANTSPIYVLTPNVDWNTVITAANTAKDGTGTVTLAFTAGAEGAYLSHLKLRSIGTNTASVCRVWINNGSTNATAANNTLYTEVTLPATNLSEVAAQPDILVPFGFGIDAGYKINLTLGTAVAAGYIPTVVGGDY